MALIFSGLYLYGLFTTIRYTQLMLIQDDLHLTTVRYLKEELHEQSAGSVVRRIMELSKVDAVDTLKHRYGDNKHVLKLMKTRDRASLPEPLQILRKYISHHGSRVVSSEIQDDTKYILLDYDCFHRAENMIGDALNKILLGVLTNRTLLLPARDRGTCDNIVHPANWIPQSDRSETLQGHDVYLWRQQEQAEQACVDIFNTTNQYHCMERLKDSSPGTASRMAVDIHEHHIIDFEGTTGCFFSEIPGWKGRFDMRLPTCGEYVRATFAGEMIDQERVDKLFKYGLDFLYGMLYRHSFELTQEFEQSIETVGGVFDPKAFTVALLSQHPTQNKDGSVSDSSDISKEVECLDNIIAKQNSYAPCQILIMTDREGSDSALTAYAKNYGCEGITVAHTKDAEENIRNGQGPFEGAGFWKNIAFVSQARHGLASTTSSSSGLLQNMMVFDRTMERLSLHQDSDQQVLTVPQRHGMEICYHQYEGPVRPDWPTSS